MAEKPCRSWTWCERVMYSVVAQLYQLFSTTQPRICCVPSAAAERLRCMLMAADPMLSAAWAVVHVTLRSAAALVS